LSELKAKSKVSNKIKVKEAARYLFNRDGLLNVRLQHISDEAIVSVGNISYHFRGKEQIVLALWQDLLAQKQAFFLEFRVVPLFEDLERLLAQVFHLQQAYRFFYVDAPSILQRFPAIAESWAAHHQQERTAIHMMLEFHVARAVLHPPLDQNFFARWAEVFWALSDGWLSRQRSLGRSETDYSAYRDMLWTLLRPLMTPQGQLEYQELEKMVARRIS